MKSGIGSVTWTDNRPAIGLAAGAGTLDSSGSGDDEGHCVAVGISEIGKTGKSLVSLAERGFQSAGWSVAAA